MDDEPISSKGMRSAIEKALTKGPLWKFIKKAVDVAVEAIKRHGIK